MQIDKLRSALEAIPAGQHGAVSVRGTPIEVPAFNWEIEDERKVVGLNYNPTLRIVKDDDSFCLVEVALVDFFFTYPIPKPKR